MLKLISVVTLFYYICFFASCGQLKKQNADRELAMNLVEQFFETLKTGNLDKTMTFYDQKMFHSFDETRWQQHLEKNYKILGPYQKRIFKKWKLRDGKQEGIQAFIFTLQYQVSYQNDDSCMETFDVILRKDGKPSTFLGHVIASLVLNAKKKESRK